LDKFGNEKDSNGTHFADVWGATNGACSDDDTDLDGVNPEYPVKGAKHMFVFVVSTMEANRDCALSGLHDHLSEIGFWCCCFSSFLHVYLSSHPLSFYSTFFSSKNSLLTVQRIHR